LESDAAANDESIFEDPSGAGNTLSPQNQFKNLRISASFAIASVAPTTDHHHQSPQQTPPDSSIVLSRGTAQRISPHTGRAASSPADIAAHDAAQKLKSKSQQAKASNAKSNDTDLSGCSHLELAGQIPPSQDSAVSPPANSNTSTSEESARRNQATSQLPPAAVAAKCNAQSDPQQGAAAGNPCAAGVEPVAERSPAALSKVGEVGGGRQPQTEVRAATETAAASAEEWHRRCIAAEDIVQVPLSPASHAPLPAPLLSPFTF
jgi:hypothetical protein